MRAKGYSTLGVMPVSPLFDSNATRRDVFKKNSTLTPSKQGMKWTCRFVSFRLRILSQWFCVTDLTHPT
jgi:hypothetical protein